MSEAATDCTKPRSFIGACMAQLKAGGAGDIELGARTTTRACLEPIGCRLPAHAEAAYDQQH